MVDNTNQITSMSTNEITLYLDKTSDLFRSYPILILILGLIALGRVIRSSPIHNAWIPLILSCSGAILTPLVSTHLPVLGRLNLTMQVLGGFTLGFFSVGIYSAASAIPFVRNNSFFQKLLGIEPENNEKTPVIADPVKPV